jgi:hypothetical protein
MDQGYIRLEDFFPELRVRFNRPFVQIVPVLHLNTALAVDILHELPGIRAFGIGVFPESGWQSMLFGSHCPFDVVYVYWSEVSLLGKGKSANGWKVSETMVCKVYACQCLLQVVSKKHMLSPGR